MRCHPNVSKSLRRVSLVQHTGRQARCSLYQLCSWLIYPLGKSIILVLGESPTTIITIIFFIIHLCPSLSTTKPPSFLAQFQSNFQKWLVMTGKVLNYKIWFRLVFKWNLYFTLHYCSAECKRVSLLTLLIIVTRGRCLPPSLPPYISKDHLCIEPQSRN